MPEHGNGISQAENEKNPKKYAHRWIDTILYHSIIAFSEKQVLIGNYLEDSTFSSIPEMDIKKPSGISEESPDGRKACRGWA